MNSLNAMFKTIHPVRATTHAGLSYRLPVVMNDQRGSLHPPVLELLSGRYTGAMFEPVIGFNSRLRESQLAGISIPVFASRSPAAQQYQTLVRELYAYAEKETLPESA
jgi:cellulose biosynthesis protein BcsQ